MINPVIHHPWMLDTEEAIALQRELASQVVPSDRQLGDIHFVAGVDAAYDTHSDQHYAAAVVLDAASLAVVELAVARQTVSFPYTPGLFSFREMPPIAAALAKMRTKPDLIVCDGQGLAHPRRFGLACHLGVLYDIPTIGCGKTRLTGEAEAPGPERGDQSALIDAGEIVGAVLRTQDNIKPIYVSVGHLIALPTACDWILRLTPRFRLPETTRQADQAVRQYKQREEKSSGRGPTIQGHRK